MLHANNSTCLETIKQRICVVFPKSFWQEPVQTSTAKKAGNPRDGPARSSRANNIYCLRNRRVAGKPATRLERHQRHRRHRRQRRRDCTSTTQADTDADATRHCHRRQRHGNRRRHNSANFAPDANADITSIPTAADGITEAGAMAVRQTARDALEPPTVRRPIRRAAMWSSLRGSRADPLGRSTQLRNERPPRTRLPWFEFAAGLVGRHQQEACAATTLRPSDRRGPADCPWRRAWQHHSRDPSPPRANMHRNATRSSLRVGARGPWGAKRARRRR